MARVARPASAALVRLDEALGDLVSGGIVPGGVVAIAGSEGVAYERAFGRRSVEPVAEDATIDTVYDVASITKPAVTASLMLEARARGVVRFEQPVTGLVPEMAPLPGEPRAPTFGELLLHAGGLPSWAPLYAVAPGGLAARAAWCARHRQEPGLRAVYGCPGYQVLGLTLERAHGTSLKALADERLLRGREGLWFGGVPDELRARTAPTEHGNAFERTLAGPDARGHAFRDELIRGDVHDLNAFTLGGAAGNAGLFATARGLALYMTRFLRPDDELSREDLAELSRDLAPHAKPGGESRTWGFQIAGSLNSFAGESAGPGSFGHAGFTGTSLLVDPSRRIVTVLLTNRVHPTVRERAFHADRRRIHDALTEAAEALRD